MTGKASNDADDRWTLRAADRALLGNKTGATRLGFAVLLKLFAAEGCFPRRAEDVPFAAVEAVAAQVGVPAAAWPSYDWRGRTVEYHRVKRLRTLTPPHQAAYPLITDEKGALHRGHQPASNVDPS